MSANIFSIANQKGGVAKTTSAINLCAYLAEEGNKVLLVDMDPQGNATSGVGYKKSNDQESIYEVLTAGISIKRIISLTKVKNLDLAPANISLAGAEVELSQINGKEERLKVALDEVGPFYDYIFIDCPPSLGLLTVNSLVASRGVLVPIQCEYYALEGLEQLMNTIHLVRSQLNPTLSISGIVLTMYDARTNLSSEVEQEVRKYLREKVFSTVIPRNVRLAEAPSYGQSILDYCPYCKGAEAYRLLKEEFLLRFGEAQETV